VWQATTIDEYSRVRAANIGATAATWGYSTTTNLLSQIKGTGVQQYDYDFSGSTRNLNSRTNTLKSKTESFGYDTGNLDRLVSVTGTSAQTIGYDATIKGNITSKTDVGNYTYDPTRKYAVKTITNGLNISTTPQSIVYNAFNKVQTITEGTKTAEFVYNADRQRIRMTLKTSGTTTKTRYYFGGSCEREVVGSATTQYIWIGGDAYTAVAVATKVGTGSWTVYNIFRDHLGTITHLKTGSTITEYSFDAWGRRRNALNWSYDLTGQPALFADRGFTTHEFLSDFNLYNMNGRLYDPVVGRFLSPDPYIADPSFSQSYNRYAYALNNPLKFTDPSGEKLKWPKFEWFNAIPVIGQFDYFMQFVNDNTTKTRQKMVNAGVPDFGAGISFSGNGIVNFNGSYRGQEVFNTQNINKGNPDVVLNELVQVRRDYGEEWMDATYGESSGLSNWWNSHWTAKVIPDVLYINVGAVYNFVGGGSVNTGYAIPIRGKDALHVYKTTTLIFKGGAHGNIGINIGYSSYTGDARNFSFEKSFGGTGTRGFDSDIIIGIGASVSSIDANFGRLYSYEIGFGPSIGASISIGSITYVKRLW
jgi:RHS repeat-associated protein